MIPIHSFIAEIFCNKEPALVDTLTGQGFTLHRFAGLTLEAPRLFPQFKRILNWKAKNTHEWTGEMLAKYPILLVEYGLLKQQSGFFVSTEGWYGKSHLAGKAHSGLGLSRLAGFVRKEFGWKIGQQGTKGGPVLVVLQNSNDHSVRMGYKPGHGNSAMVSFLTVCREYLGDTDVLIRPHPKYRDEFFTALRRGVLNGIIQPGWKVDYSPSIYETIPKCRAVVTICSTVATEVCTTTVPVFTLGSGPYSGTGSVYEGRWAFTRFAELCKRSVDIDARLQYTARVLKDQIPVNASEEVFLKNGEFTKWLERCKEETP